MPSELEAPKSSSEDMFDEQDVFIDMYNDPRVLWFKDRILAFIGIEDDKLFYDLFEEPEPKQLFVKYITGAIKPNELCLDKRMMYVSKMIVDKLIHEDKEFTEWSKLTFDFYYSICCTRKSCNTMFFFMGPGKLASPSKFHYNSKPRFNLNNIQFYVYQLQQLF